MNDLRIEILNTSTQTKCFSCADFVKKKSQIFEENPIYYGDHCKNPKSPYFMRRPGTKCDFFTEREE